ncbi:MAG: hypothetical protein Q8N82_07045 [Deltaproteobacteria bacterium]|nr:hypothetical protein [Deltaproteobacteria bacterium]
MGWFAHIVEIFFRYGRFFLFYLQPKIEIASPPARHAHIHHQKVKNLRRTFAPSLQAYPPGQIVDRLAVPTVRRRRMAGRRSYRRGMKLAPSKIGGGSRHTRVVAQCLCILL